MMYPFMTLNDGTEIVHSETLPDGRVKVYIEKPDEELAHLKDIISSTANLILEFAADGGFENASGF